MTVPTTWPTVGTAAEVISFPEQRLRRDLKRLAEALDQPEWVVAFVLRRAKERLKALELEA